MTVNVDVHLRETDAFSWTMEKDPALRMPVMALAVVEGRPDWDEVVRRMDRVAHAVPLFRQRIVPTPGNVAPPRWVTADDFDLSWHVRRAVVPPPATLDVVLDFAAKLAMAAFDPVRPMWEVWLLDGLAGGRSVWLAKVHHTMTDGVGGMQLLTHVFDLDGAPLAAIPVSTASAATATETPPSATTSTSAAAMLRAGLVHDLRRAWQATRASASIAVRTTTAVGSDPRAGAAGATATWRTLLEAVAPSGARLSPQMTGRGVRRRYATLDVELDDLRRAGHLVGGTVNDAFLTAVTGGLCRYHQLHETVPDELRMTLPIDVRESGDAEAGNRIALIRLLVPVAVTDPVERMAQIRTRVERWKQAPGLEYIEAAYALVNHLPASYLQGLARNVDFVASNVPAFPMPVGLAGGRLAAMYAFGPTGGTALNVTMLSYNGKVHVGIDVDVDAVPDVHAFVTCMRAGFDEVVALTAEGRRAAPRGVSVIAG